MSALFPKADMCGALADVRSVPQADFHCYLQLLLERIDQVPYPAQNKLIQRNYQIDQSGKLPFKLGGKR